MMTYLWHRHAPDEAALLRHSATQGILAVRHLPGAVPPLPAAVPRAPAGRRAEQLGDPGRRGAALANRGADEGPHEHEGRGSEGLPHGRVPDEEPLEDAVAHLALLGLQGGPRLGPPQCDPDASLALVPELDGVEAGGDGVHAGPDARDLDLPGHHHLEGAHAKDGVDHPVHLRGLQRRKFVDVLHPPLVASLRAVALAKLLLQEGSDLRDVRELH
mmetsp:Transcript_55280/g.145536  ORF Transcript_55280/g.145536 Transcript_55280/m.145536 type:complete len:216 (-) Transcript_55280:182-829(-)